MAKIQYKKIKNSYWGGNGVGDIPASWAVFVDGKEVLHISGRASYNGKWFAILNLEGNFYKEICNTHYLLKHAKMTIDRHFN